MEVKIKPLSGCLRVFLAVVSLGVAPLAEWSVQRSWPKLVDEQGVVNRAGRRIAWNEFTAARRVITRVNGSSSGVEHFEFSYPKGKLIVAAYRLEDGDRILDTIWQHLPESAKGR